MPVSVSVCVCISSSDDNPSGIHSRIELAIVIRSLSPEKRALFMLFFFLHYIIEPIHFIHSRTW